MRVYLASTMPALAAALQAGQIGPAPLAGFAVTPALREWYASGDLDELEYAALAVAARASLRLLAADAAAPPRRVTLAADVPDESGQQLRRSRRARRGPRQRPRAAGLGGVRARGRPGGRRGRAGGGRRDPRRRSR